MKTSSGPEKVNQYLNRFAIATVLAVGLLALTRPAAAEIVYTQVNITIGANTSYNLDVNNDGITDFTIAASLQTKVGSCPDGEHFHLYTTSVVETPASGNSAEGSPPAALSKGDLIGPNQTYYAGQGTLRSFYETVVYHPLCRQIYHGSGDWIGGSKHYLGLALQINGETYYGWAELSVNVGYGVATATLWGYAYETVPGMPISAGQTSGADESSALRPGPVNPHCSSLGASITNRARAVSLGTLAACAQDIPLLRRKDSAGVVPQNAAEHFIRGKPLG